jgi:6-phosphogluconolactonase
MHGDVVVVDDVAAEFAERVIEAFHGRPADGFSLMLSGGATARHCYERLAQDAGTQIDWWKVDVYWGDERCVPADHPESNYHLARESLLDRVGAANATYPMRCEEGPDPYQLRLGELGKADVVHLGLGPDGHTASLFPGTAALGVEDRLAVANDVPQLGTRRLTLTYPVFREAGEVFFLVTGRDKHAALADVVRPGSTLPAARIIQRTRSTCIFCDRDAAQDIKPSP